MARAPKTVENMSKNLTKSEREYLENAEKATLSGMPIREFKKTKKDKTVLTDKLNCPDGRPYNNTYIPPR